MQPDLDTAVGQQVQAIDGHQLGKITAVEAERMRIHPRHGTDYWLDRILVRTVDPAAVTLHVDRRTLTRYQVHETGVTPGNWFRRASLAMASLVGAGTAAVATLLTF